MNANKREWKTIELSNFGRLNFDPCRLVRHLRSFEFIRDSFFSVEAHFSNNVTL
jgi:hypothetical protein